MRAAVRPTERRDTGGGTGLLGKMSSSLWGRHVHLEVPGKFQVNVLKQALVCVHPDSEGRRAGGETGFSLTAGERGR